MIRTMRAALAVLALALGCAGAAAQSSFPTPGGGRVDGKPLMCPNGSTDFQGLPFMVPCGDSGKPISIVGSLSASLTAGWVDGAGATGNPFTLTSTPTVVTLPSPFTNFIVQNTGGTNDMVCQPGATITNAGITVPAKQTIEFLTGASTQVTCSSAIGTTLSVRAGSGFYNGVGGAGGSGGSGGAVTIADGANVAQGTTTDASTANTLIGLTKAIKASTGLSATAALQAAINGDGGSLAHITNFPATQPVSAVSLPLPTGAATQTTLASILSSLGSPIQTTGGVVTANSSVNQTVTQCAGSITSGGTAQVAIAAQTTLHQFTITNNDATHGSGEPLWISLTTTAAAGGTGSDPLAAPTATSFAGMGSVTIANGTNHAISIFGATTGHTFGCFWS